MYKVIAPDISLSMLVSEPHRPSLRAQGQHEIVQAPCVCAGFTLKKKQNREPGQRRHCLTH